MSYEVTFTPEQLELKAKFAELLLESPDNPFIAAQAVFPDSTAHALYVANNWLADPEVLAAKKRLRLKGADLNTLANKADLARDVWRRMKATYDPDAYAKLAKLYAEIMGHIEKPQAVAPVNIVNRVMVVKDKGTDAQWESGVAKQQAELLNASNTRH